MLRPILVSLLLAACSVNGATFQKVTHQEKILATDVSSCSENSNSTLDVFFTNTGIAKLGRVMDEGNTVVNIIIDGQLIASVALPNAMEDTSHFRFSVSDPKMLADHFGCKMK